MCIRDSIEADNVVRVYYAKDEEGGPDDIPDYAQIVFTLSLIHI